MSNRSSEAIGVESWRFTASTFPTALTFSVAAKTATDPTEAESSALSCRVAQLLRWRRCSLLGW